MDELRRALREHETHGTRACHALGHASLLVLEACEALERRLGPSLPPSLPPSTPSAGAAPRPNATGSQKIAAEDGGGVGGMLTAVMRRREPIEDALGEDRAKRLRLLEAADAKLASELEQLGLASKV